MQSLLPLFLFLRHGQAKNNVERILAGRAKGFPLTELGIQQAEQIGKFLESFNVSKIYC
ncbi:MAG: histidine phosphatase family protein, partial [Nitrosotalea sp.]